MLVCNLSTYALQPSPDMLSMLGGLGQPASTFEQGAHVEHIFFSARLLVGGLKPEGEGARDQKTLLLSLLRGRGCTRHAAQGCARAAGVGLGRRHCLDRCLFTGGYGPRVLSGSFVLLLHTRTAQLTRGRPVVLSGGGLGGPSRPAPQHPTARSGHPPTHLPTRPANPASSPRRRTPLLVSAEHSLVRAVPHHSPLSLSPSPAHPLPPNNRRSTRSTLPPSTCSTPRAPTARRTSGPAAVPCCCHSLPGHLHPSNHLPLSALQKLPQLARLRDWPGREVLDLGCRRQRYTRKPPSHTPFSPLPHSLSPSPPTPPPPAIAGELQVQPNLVRRSSQAPAGLVNLGATCYVNSLLQMWYHNPAFRSTVLAYEPEPLRQSSPADAANAAIFAQLQRVFAQLMYTPAWSVPGDEASRKNLSISRSPCSASIPRAS